MAIALLPLAVIGLIAFCCAAVGPESEVVLHYMTPDEFARTRVISIFIGTIAVLCDALFIYLLFRRRSAGGDTHVA